MNPQTIDILIHAKWVIPVLPKNTVFSDYCLAVHEGKIIDLLPSGNAENKYQADITHHLDQHALTPGFINNHTHVAMSLFRGIADDLPLMDWLNNHIWPAEGKWVNREFVADGTSHAIAEMLRSGITCFNDMYFFPDETARIASQAGIRASVGMIVIDFPTVWAENQDEYFAKGLSLHDEFRQNSLISTAFAPHAPYTVSDQPLIKIQSLAEELDIPIHMHIHETADEVAQSIDQCGMRPLERLTKLGLLSPRLLAVHMTQLNDTEIEQVAETGTHVLHCPESNMKLASGFCPVDSLLNAGVNISLGTDGVASNNDHDFLGEMKSAALLAKVVANDASAAPAEMILEMATINGARALGLEDQIGSLEIGKFADVIAIDLAQLESTPVYNPVSQIVYSAGRENVTDVWVAGKHLLNNRALTSLDENKLLNTAKKWQEKIANT